MGLFKNLLGTVLDEFRIGRGNAGNKALIAYVRDSNPPAMRWNNSSEHWEISEDGTAFSTIRSSADALALVESGTSAPSSTPSALGSIYIDTSAGNVYVAKGTGSSADWVKVN
jgi:hypothetical protein